MKRKNLPTMMTKKTQAMCEIGKSVTSNKIQWLKFCWGEKSLPESFFYCDFLNAYSYYIFIRLFYSILFYSILFFFILFFSILLYSTAMQVTASQRGTHLKGPMEHGRKALKRKQPLPIDTDAQHKYDQIEQTHEDLHRESARFKAHDCVPRILN